MFTENSPEVLNYVSKVQELMNNHWIEMKYTHAKAPKITIEAGSKYLRIVKVDIDNNEKEGSKSVHTFIDTTNGNVLKANGWKAPCTKNPRSNITDASNGIDGVTQYGAKYLK
jgi:hypothetical protein